MVTALPHLQRLLLGAILLVASFVELLPAKAEIRMSVTNEANIRRTCPSYNCGAVGRFFPGESVIVYETVEGWSRVSGYHAAACYDGQSAIVDSGTSACTTANGIKNGEFAEWLRSDFLRPDVTDYGGT